MVIAFVLALVVGLGYVAARHWADVAWYARVFVHWLEGTD